MPDPLAELTQALLKFACYLQSIFTGAFAYAQFAAKNLCAAWYPLVILTLIPVLKLEIPHHWAVAYLLVYCVVAGWVCISEPSAPKKHIESAMPAAGFMRTIKIDSTSR